MFFNSFKVIKPHLRFIDQLPTLLVKVYLHWMKAIAKAKFFLIITVA